MTNDQVATLQALLSGDYELYQQRHAELDRAAASSGYSALIAAAFFKAVNKRFSVKSSHADIVEYVGDIRARSDDAAQRLDPLAAETLIGAVLGRNSDEELDDKTVIQTQMMVLGALVADDGLDSDGLDRFLADARQLADEWLS